MMHRRGFDNWGLVGLLGQQRLRERECLVSVRARGVISGAD